MPEIILPNGWLPRPYQRPLWDYLEEGGRRAIAIWHRRAGKDDLCLHWTAVAAMQRVGTYWHMLPEYEQGRKVLWNAVNPKTGRRRIDDAFPSGMCKRTNDQGMFIEFVNGSTWQVVGSDRYDKTVGSSPVGIVFSEWALANEAAWAYLSPMVVENDGWAVFITTPRGRNHAHRMYEMAQMRHEWFADRLAWQDTGVFRHEQIEEQRAEYRALYGVDDGDAKIEQEYCCSFEAAILGSYYGRLMADAEREGRICEFEPDRDAKVYTAWDIGVGDSTAIWWYQIVGQKILILDYYEAQGHGSQHYVDVLRSKPYRYERDSQGIKAFLPHDVSVKEWGTGLTRVETLVAKGISPERIPIDKIDDGINAARQILPKCWFRKSATASGCEMLRQYCKEYDEDNKVFKDKPRHDWSSHGADAFRYLAMSYQQMVPASPKSQRKMMTVGPGNEVTFDELWPEPQRASNRRI